MARSHGCRREPVPDSVQVTPTPREPATLISHPPRSLTSDMSLIGWLDERLDIISRRWAGAAGGEA